MADKSTDLGELLGPHSNAADPPHALIVEDNCLACGIAEETHPAVS